MNAFSGSMFPKWRFPRSVLPLAGEQNVQKCVAPIEESARDLDMLELNATLCRLASASLMREIFESDVLWFAES
jgi:hypothetical protein